MKFPISLDCKFEPDSIAAALKEKGLEYLTAPEWHGKLRFMYSEKGVVICMNPAFLERQTARIKRVALKEAGMRLSTEDAVAIARRNGLIPGGLSGKSAIGSATQNGQVLLGTLYPIESRES